MKVKFKKNVGGSFLIAIFLVCIFFNSALAQEDLDLTSGISKGIQVSPYRFDWDLNSGEVRTGVINLKNYSDKDYEVEIQVEDFYVVDDSSEARFFVPQAGHPLFAYDVINWIEVENKIHLDPNEGKDVFFTVRVPENAPTGGYYGALFFKTAVQEASNTNEDGEKTQVLINQRVGVLLVMAVKGKEPIELSARLQKFIAKKKIFFGSPASFLTEISNDGNLHFKGLGKIDVYKFGKRKVSSVAIDSRFNYPNKVRSYDSNWDFSFWAHGFYTAKLDFYSEDMKIKLTGETTFWVIPWKETVAIILILIVLWIIYKIFTSKFEIKKKEKEELDDDDKKKILENMDKNEFERVRAIIEEEKKENKILENEEGGDKNHKDKKRKIV